jgi:hypothetical protein
MTVTPTSDTTRTEAFAEKVMADFAGASAESGVRRHRQRARLTGPYPSRSTTAPRAHPTWPGAWPSPP